MKKFELCFAKLDLTKTMKQLYDVDINALYVSNICVLGIEIQTLKKLMNMQVTMLLYFDVNLMKNVNDLLML